MTSLTQLRSRRRLAAESLNWQQQPRVGGHLVLDHSHPLAQGLCKWYLCNEGAGEHIESLDVFKRRGVLSGGMNQTAWSVGRTGGFCLNFDGDNNYVDLGISVYDLGIRRNATFMLWCKGRDFATQINELISDFGASKGITLRVDRGSVVFYVYPGNYRVIYSAGLQSNVWYHLTGVMAYDTVEVYVNGYFGNSSALSANVGISSRTLKIGDRGDGLGGNEFNGWAQDVRVYDRTLSRSEIRDIYEGANPLIPVVPSFRFPAPSTFPVSRSAELGWDLLSLQQKELTLTWDIESLLAPVSRQLGLDWNIRLSANRLAQFEWNTSELVDRLISIDWNVISVQPKSLTLSWDMEGPVSKQISVSWTVCELFNRPIDLNWNLDSLIVKSSIFAWDIDSQVARELSIDWDALELATRTLPIDWHLRNKVGRSGSLNWNLTGLVTKSLNFDWDIKISGTSQISFNWNISELANKALVLDWDLRGSVNLPLELGWDVESVINTVGRAIGLGWDVEGLAPVSKTVPFNWNISNTLNKALVSSWALRELLSKDSELLWNICNTLNKQLRTYWNIRLSGSKSLYIRWDMTGQLGKHINIRWDLGEPTEEVCIIKIQGENRRIQVPSENRKFTFFRCIE